MPRRNRELPSPRRRLGSAKRGGFRTRRRSRAAAASSHNPSSTWLVSRPVARAKSGKNEAPRFAGLQYLAGDCEIRSDCGTVSEQPRCIFAQRSQRGDASRPGCVGFASCHHLPTRRGCGEAHITSPTGRPIEVQRVLRMRRRRTSDSHAAAIRSLKLFQDCSVPSRCLAAYPAPRAAT